MGIYSIRNINNGKHYVGSSSNVFRRMKEHRQALIRGRHHSRYLQRAWGIHGQESFEFALQVEVFDPSDLLPVEQMYIDAMGDYNVTPVAGRTVVKWTQVSRENFSKKCMGRRISENAKRLLREANLGRTFSAEVREKVRLARLGKKHSPETLEKLRAAKLGKPLTEAHRLALSVSLKGRVHTPEAIAKMSASKKGKPQNPEAVEKMRKTKTGQKQSPETIQKRADANRGKTRSEETKEKMKAAWARRRAAKQNPA